MKSERYTSIDSTYGGKGLRFNARISGRNVGINVEQEVILRLAEMTKTAGHIGHALWHFNNPDDKFPCTTCKPEAYYE